MRTVRTLEAEWWKVLWGGESMGVKGYESNNGRVWAAGFHLVTANSLLAGVLRLTNRLFP
jgi:hypothetical protein